MNEVFYNDLNPFINKKIYFYFFFLLKDILLVKTSRKQNSIDSTLKKLTENINRDIIKKKEKYINFEYSTNNFRNIIDCIKSQNKRYAGDILEGILIKIFGFTFNLDKDNTFEKNILGNSSILRNSNNLELGKWIRTEIIKPQELKDINQLLKLELEENDISNLSQKSTFFNLIIEIMKLKYENIYRTNNTSKTNIYLNKGNFLSYKIIKNIYEKIYLNTSNYLKDNDFKYNSISTLLSFLYKSNDSDNNTPPVLLIKNFLISSFIYYLNENSSFINYNKEEIKNNKILVKIPFIYNLSDAIFDGRYAPTILSPCKFSNNISKIDIRKNNFRELGFLEISKALLFNKNLKSIDCSSDILRTYYIDFLNFEQTIFQNNTLEELHFSLNFINGDCEEYLAKLLLHLKGLKTLNLSKNDLKGGLSSFFVVLKKLYRKNNIKIENLIINRCLLDDGSFYELGELLKCKYCRLKRLYISYNPIPSNVNLLKKIKYNKSLIEIHINNSNISGNKVDDINIMISHSNLKEINLFKNKIYNFNELLKIIYRTKLINDYSTKNKSIIIDKKIYLIHLDLSNNNVFHRNIEHIKILNRIVEYMNLYCLDISHILYGPNPDSFKRKDSENRNYRRIVDLFKKKLEDDKKAYYQVIKKINSNQVNVSNLKNIEKEKIFELFKEKEINDIIKNKNSGFTIFLKRKIREKTLKILEDKVSNKDVIDKLYTNNETIKEEIYKKVEAQLVSYLIYKRSKELLNQLYKKRDQKKIIII